MKRTLPIHFLAFIAATAADAETVANPFDTDPAWTPGGPAAQGDTQLGYQASTPTGDGNFTGAMGGTFGRPDQVVSFADTTRFTEPLDGDDVIEASGTLWLGNLANGNNDLILGHFDTNSANGRAPAIGLRIREPHSSVGTGAEFRVEFLAIVPSSTVLATSGVFAVPPDPPDGSPYSFRYSYDPASGAHGAITYSFDGGSLGSPVSGAANLSTSFAETLNAFGFLLRDRSDATHNDGSTYDVLLDQASYSAPAAPANGGLAYPPGKELFLDQRWVRLPDAAGEEDGPAIAPKSAENAEFNSTEDVIAVSTKGEGTVGVWDLAGNPLAEVEAVAETEALTFLHGEDRPDQYIATGGEIESFDDPPVYSAPLKVWEWDAATLTLNLKREFPVGFAGIEGLRLSPDRTLLATGDEAGELRLWDISDPDPANWPATPAAIGSNGADPDHPVNTGPDHADINQVDWTDDGQFVFSAGRNGMVRKWRVYRVASTVSLNEDPASPFLGHTKSVKCVRLSPDNTLVASGDSESSRTTNLARLTVHDTTTGALILNTVVEKTRIIETVEFTPDGKYLLAGGQDAAGISTFGVISIWKVADILAGPVDQPPSQLVYVAEQEYFDFTDDGSLLATANSDGTLRLFDVAEKSMAFNPTHAKPFVQQTGGDELVCFEAEDYHTEVRTAAHRWEPFYHRYAVGRKAMKSGPDPYSPRGTNLGSNFTAGPRLDYQVAFHSAGTYYVWARGRTYDDDQPNQSPRQPLGEAGDPTDDTFNIGLNGAILSPDNATQMILESANQDYQDWTWTKTREPGGAATLTIPSPGVHTIHLWMREDGCSIDRIVLAPSAGYDPGAVNGGDGPAPSEPATDSAHSIGFDATTATGDALRIDFSLTRPASYDDAVLPIALISEDMVTWSEVTLFGAPTLTPVDTLTERVEYSAESAEWPETALFQFYFRR